jgi:hypothetical protein
VGVFSFPETKHATQKQAIKCGSRVQQATKSLHPIEKTLSKTTALIDPTSALGGVARRPNLRNRPFFAPQE